MAVNPRKTQLLCISPAVHSEISAYLDLPDGSKIQSQDHLTILGFRFGSRPTVGAHVDYIEKKFNSRSWMVRHLKLAGVPPDDIAAVFATTIRPVIEYAAPAYHWMLTEQQSAIIERMQRRSLKTVYGHRVSYDNALEKSGLKTMLQRREDICDKFVSKCVRNTLWDHWFPLQQAPSYDLRRKRRYLEEWAHTDRLYRSPIYSMRRLLNADFCC